MSALSAVEFEVGLLYARRHAEVTAPGALEMIRLVKVAKDVAVKGRTSAMISLKAVLVNAPVE